MALQWKIQLPISSSHKPSQSRKVAIAILVGTVTLAMLSALAFYLYKHRVRHPDESQKLVGSNSQRTNEESRIPTSTFLYIGTMEPSTGSTSSRHLRSQFHLHHRLCRHQENWGAVETNTPPVSKQPIRPQPKSSSPKASPGTERKSPVKEVESIRRIVSGFVEKEKSVAVFNGDDFRDVCSTAMLRVAKTVDAYLGEISTYVDLNWEVICHFQVEDYPHFCGVAVAIAIWISGFKKPGVLNPGLNSSKSKIPILGFNNFFFPSSSSVSLSLLLTGILFQRLTGQTMGTQPKEEDIPQTAGSQQDHMAVGWGGKIEEQYRKIKEHAETYPYVWGSYILVYGGFGLWLTYRWRKLRRTEDRVRGLQERLRKLVEAEQSTNSVIAKEQSTNSSVINKALPSADKESK
ncbi:Uncharacterized protein Adt_14317 [Abeliophyllum distichum]|uniref:Transmembrane protein n=1 Tax=Abeliophyllum distichum TaxID=126358 RepID=A0ABD1TZB4_9LAMI